MTTFALNNLWTYLQGLSLSQGDREWLANKLRYRGHFVKIFYSFFSTKKNCILEAECEIF